MPARVMRAEEEGEMVLVVRNITFSSRDPTRLADFWAAATGYTSRRDSDHEILLAPANWDFPRFTFQRVAEPNITAGRLHLDLTADDMEAEVTRLVGLGATRARMCHADESGTTTWTVLLDPDGNELCVVQRSDGD